MKSFSKRPSNVNALHSHVRRLLKKYKSEYRLHEVRAQFMGAIASPVEIVNPMQEIKSLWNGDLPSLKNMDAINELVKVFAMGLWNQLSSHCDPENPFKLLLFEEPIETDKELKRYALIKNEEIECFIFGFYQGAERLKLPLDISKSLDALEDISDMFAATASMPERKNTANPPIGSLLLKLNRLSIIAEKEINTIIISSNKARRHANAQSRTLH